jgi:hypothetical protein
MTRRTPATFDPATFLSKAGIGRLEKVDGKWLFKTRTYPYLYLDTDPFTGKAVALSADSSFT